MIRLSGSVSTRGLILVLVPLIMQVVFVLWLAAVLANAQQKLKAQWASEALIQKACELSRDTTDVIVYMQMPRDIKEMVGRDVSQAGMERPRKDFEILKQMAGKNPRHKEALENIENVGFTLGKLQQREKEKLEQLQRSYDKLDEIKQRRAIVEEGKARQRSKLMASGNAVPERLMPETYQDDSVEKRQIKLNRKRIKHLSGVQTPDDYKVTLAESGPKFYDAIDQLVNNEEEVMKDVNSFGARSISDINTMLFLVSFLGIGVTLALGYLYSVSIRNPLRHLGENGRRLSLRQALLPELAGQDEFAQLDHLLHLNSSEVEIALSRERAVMDNAADLICVLDENGYLLSVNPFVERMLGYLSEELLGQPINVLASVEHSLLADEFVRNSQTGSEQLFELRLKGRNGDIVETRWSCIWSQEDKKLFCVVHDITEEKAIEQLKQDFADMISHDLRSPLMAMSNSFTLIEAGAKGEISPEAKVSVQASAKNVEKLIALVNDLLDFQKLKAGKMQLKLESCSLRSIVAEAAELLAESAQQKSVHLLLPEAEIMVDCDYNKILQTVVNLLSNAIKFSEPNSSVKVDARLGAGNVILSVSDSGPGVPEAFRDKIFEPFEQAPSSRAKEGTGLGLAICKLVAEAHGGRVYVESLPSVEPVRPPSSTCSEGSVFVLELPISAGL